MRMRRVLPMVVLPAVALAAASLWMWWGAGRADSATFSVTGRPLGRIPPGTRIGERAPDGWSYLIFKSYSELTSGDVKSLPEFARTLAEFLFTSMVARVVPDEPGGSRVYRIDAVAIGLGTRVGQDDVVITVDTQAKLGADLGPFKQTILSRAEQHLDTIRRVAASEAMWIVDAPSIMLVEEEHRKVVLRYVFLAKPSTGQLASVVWRIDVGPDGTYQRAAGPAVMIQQGLVGRCPLHVDGRKIFAGIPASDAFAAARLPKGAPFELPQPIMAVAGQQQLTADAAAELEAALRQEIVFPEAK
jgi:hypothetical protein